MTVIAYRDGVMASDSGAFSGNRVWPWCRKVARGPDGALWGIAAAGSEVLAWVDGGYQGLMPSLGGGGDDVHVLEVLVARPDGRLRILTHRGEENCDAAPYMTLGGADAPALGALFTGADAETAVRASIMHSNMAAGEIQVVRFPA